MTLDTTVSPAHRPHVIDGDRTGRRFSGHAQVRVLAEMEHGA